MENVNVFAMNLGDLETDVLRKLWRQFREDSDGWAPDVAFTDPLSRTRVRRKINQALAEIASFAKCNKCWFVVPTKQNYGQYPVPQNVIDIMSPIYYFTGASAYIELDVYDEADLDDSLSLTSWRMETGSQPSVAYAGFTNRIQRYVGIHPIPTADASAMSLDAAVLERINPSGVVGGVSGSATTGSGATKMVDADGRNFENLGVIIGAYILNITDGSKGAITSLSTTNSTNDSINVSALTGGSANTFAAGDEFRIVHGTYGGIIEIGDIDANFLLAPNPGSIPHPLVTMAAGNMLVRTYIMPAKLVDKYQYPELPLWYHSSISIRAAGLLAEEFPVDSPEYAQAVAYLKRSDDSIAMLRGEAREMFKGDNRYLQSRRS